MEGNSLVKEITPEEVKTIDPFEISYIAMKDGSIIMVMEKKINRENNFEIKEIMKEKKEYNSPNFNLKGKKCLSFINQKIENNKDKKKNIIEKNQKIDNNQKENEEDFNVYYSNNKNNNIKRDNSYFLNNNNNLIEDNINNYSFYSNDDIHQNYQAQSIINSKNNNKLEFIYLNENLNKKDKNNGINKSIKKVNDENENKSPYYVLKRKYYFYKKQNNKNGNNLKKETLNDFYKTYNYNISPKRKNNLYIYGNYNISNNEINKDNISIKSSKYSINDNKIISNYLKNINNTDSKFDKRKSNTYCTCGLINQTKENKYTKKNKTILNNEHDNYYELYNKPKIDTFDINEYSFKKNQKNQKQSLLINKNDGLILDKEHINKKSKTPLYTMRDLRRNANGNKKVINNKKYKYNLELKKCLTKDNHRYYERKDLSVPKKSKSNYFKMRDFNGKTVHVFENNN